MQGHFDGVIKRFRETHVSSWGNADSPALSAIIDRLRTLYPSESDTQIHVLHLASDGEILPHVDNVGASGSWILGVSLGATRVLRLEGTDDAAPRAPFDLPLPSGSVYMQRQVVQYEPHSPITYAQQRLHSIWLQALHTASRRSISWTAFECHG